MKIQKAKSAIILMGLFIIVFAIPVSADSSWQWITDTRPYDVLPFVVIGTLLIETVSINIFPKIYKPAKVFCVVTLGNLFSYSAPYIVRAIFGLGDPMNTLVQSINHIPLYTVGIAYLIMTIAAELPLDYFLLRKDTANKRVLILTIVGVNILTSALVAIVERTLCYGRW